MEAACEDVNFPCGIVGGVRKLRIDNKQAFTPKSRVTLPLAAHLGVLF